MRKTLPFYTAIFVYNYSVYLAMSTPVVVTKTRGDKSGSLLFRGHMHFTVATARKRIVIVIAPKAEFTLLLQSETV